MNEFKFKLHLWRWKGPAAWYFVTVPKKESETIRKYFGEVKRSWGSLPVKAMIGKTRWETSIFPDRKLGAYLLPVKSEIRKIEKLNDGDRVQVTITVRM